jgi:hypothetical protein
MRKLTILKSLVDFIWIITCIPLIPILLFFAVYIFINDEAISLFINSGDGAMDFSSVWTKVFLISLFVLIYVVIYCVYLFRKTLRTFQQRKPFSITVIDNFNTIGKLLVISGISFSLLVFIYNLIFEGKFKISLGVTSYLGIVCLGLFFLVLSEVFKIAKTAKEENELTV